MTSSLIIINPTIAIGYNPAADDWAWYVFGLDPEDGSYLDGLDHGGFPSDTAALVAARRYYPAAPVTYSDTAQAQRPSK